MEADAKRLGGFDTCTLSDALEALGHAGAINGLVPFSVARRIAGPAVTVRLRQVDPGETPTGAPHLGARAIEASQPGAIIVIEHGGRTDSAGWGGLLSTAAAAVGVEGVVIDGAARDIDDAVELGFPLFAKAATPVTARGRTIEVETGGSIRLGDVEVKPGDIVVADRSGVVVVPAALVADVVERADRLQAREAEMLAAIASGVPAARVLDASYDRMLQSSDQDS